MSPKFRRKFKYSENSFDGELILEGARVRLLFRYAPEKVAFIKGIKGARYDAENKSWTIPKDKYREILASKHFPIDRYPRYFSESELERSAEEIANDQLVAQAALRKDPFAVDSRHIPYLNLDVAFFLAADKPQLRARVRFGSKAAPLLVRMRGSHFLRSEGLFAIPAETLSDLLIKLRDKKLIFAVEAECGERLKSTAPLRKRLLDSNRSASPAELEEAYLTPYVDFAEVDGDVAFTVKHATSRHLAALFPDDDNFHARKKKSLALNEQDLLRLVNRLHSQKYPLYLSRAVRSHLERRGLDFEKALTDGNLSLSEEILTFVKTAAAWVVLDHNRSGLLIDESISSQQALKEFKYESVSGKRFFCADNLTLIDLYEALKGSVAAKETDKFRELIQDLYERRINLNVNRLAREASDIQLDDSKFTDRDLPARLFPHQRVAVNWLCERQYSMLGDDMGLGKTLSVLAAADSMLKSGEISLLLIICPNSLTRNWQREAATFLPQRRFYILPEDRAERGRMLRAIKRKALPCDALVLNYERARLPDVHDGLKSILEGTGVGLCCDESQRIKNARSKTFTAVKDLAAMCEKRICLTGTPTPRDITDIWAQVQILDGGQRFGKNYAKWLKTIAELGTKYSDYAVKKFIPGAIDEVTSRVHELLLRRKKEDVLSLPEKTFVERDCKLVGSQAERYKEICDQLLVRVSTLDGGNFIKQIDNLLEEYLRAVQAASNPRLLDQNWQGDPVKFTEIDEIVNEVVREQGGKIVIWTNFLRNVDELCERYKDLGARPFSGKVAAAERHATVQAFQNSPDVKVLVAVPAAGGVGITLTAAQTAVYLDKSWNAEHWLQSVDRIHRIGQRGTVTIISLSACKIDDLIHKSLLRKGKMQEKLLRGESQGTESDDYPSHQEFLDALRN